MYYCNREHQASHFRSHKRACRLYSGDHEVVEYEEQLLRNHPGDEWTPPNLFTSSVGYFWGIHETRDYMHARWDEVEGLQRIKTRESVQLQLDNVKDMLRLCRKDNMGVRDHVPALMLRLGLDQDCYDFIKWYGTTGMRGDYDWGDMSEPFLDIKNADVFEPVEPFCGKYQAVGHNVALTLLKFKLLFDLRNLHSNSAAAVGEHVPSEILDGIQAEIPLSPIISNNNELMQRRDHTETIAKLTAQVKTLYKEVRRANMHMWKGLLQPKKYMQERPGMYSPGSVEEMQLALWYSNDAWEETPGAIDLLQEVTNEIHPPVCDAFESGYI